jgi:hypothetical protein
MAASRRITGRFSTKRKLQSGSHQEAEELWDYSGSRYDAGHTSKDSIANHITLGHRKNMESLPFGTFKNAVVPHSYTVSSVDTAAQPTGQPVFSLVSKLEYAALENVPHLLPPGYLRGGTVITATEGRDDLMRGARTRRYKTSYTSKHGKGVAISGPKRSHVNLRAKNAAAANRTANVNMISGASDAETAAEKKAQEEREAGINSDLTGSKKLNQKDAQDVIGHITKIGASILVSMRSGNPLAFAQAIPHMSALLSKALSADNLSQVLAMMPMSVRQIPGVQVFVDWLNSEMFGSGMSVGDLINSLNAYLTRMYVKMNPTDTGTGTPGQDDASGATPDGPRRQPTPVQDPSGRRPGGV